MKISRRWVRLSLAVLGAGVLAALPSAAMASGSDDSHRDKISVKKKAVSVVPGEDGTVITWKILVENKGSHSVGMPTVTDGDLPVEGPYSAIRCSNDDNKYDRSKKKKSKGKKSAKKSHSGSKSSCSDDPEKFQKGEKLTYTVVQTVPAPACGWVHNQATVVVPGTHKPVYVESSKSSKTSRKAKKTKEYKKKISYGEPVDTTLYAKGKVFLPCPDFEVTKEAGAAEYNFGGAITWIVTVKNTGNVPLKVTDIKDPGVVFSTPASASNSAAAKKHAMSNSKDESCDDDSKGDEECDEKKDDTPKGDTKGDKPSYDGPKGPPKHDDDECTEDSASYSSHSSSKGADCGVKPGETLVFIGTETADQCGTATNVAEVTAVVKMHHRGKNHKKGKKDEDDDKKDKKSESVKKRVKSSHTSEKSSSKVMITRTSNEAQTNVVCLLKVTKTASAVHTRTFDWGIDKTSPSENGTVTTADTVAQIAYNAALTKTEVGNTYVVSGDIAVMNPNPFPVTDVVVTDAINGTSCTVAGGDGTIGPGETDAYTYTCSLGSATNGSNQASVSWNEPGPVARNAQSDPVPFEFGSPVLVHETVNLSDVFDGQAPVALLNGVSASTSHAYTGNAAVPATAGECRNVVNTATFVDPADTSYTKSDQVTVQVCRSGDGGVLGSVQPGTTPGATPGTIVAGAPVRRPVLRITKTGPRGARAGQLVRYTIRVRNSSRLAARGVILRDILPSGYSLARKVKGATLRSGRLTWRVGTLAAGKSRTVRVTFRIGRSIKGGRCNQAVVTSSNAATKRARACTRITGVAGAVQPAVTG